MVAQVEFVRKHRTSPGGIITLTGVEVPSKNTCNSASEVAVAEFRMQMAPSMFTQYTTKSLAASTMAAYRSSLNLLQPKLQPLTVEVMSPQTSMELALMATMVKSQYPSSPQWFLLSAFEVATVLSAVASVPSRWQELNRKKVNNIAAKVVRVIPTGGGGEKFK